MERGGSCTYGPLCTSFPDSESRSLPVNLWVSGPRSRAQKPSRLCALPIDCKALARATPHSARSAAVGSTPEARHAGRNPANNATRSRASETLVTVCRLPGEMPNSILAMSRVATSAHGMPRTIPNSASTSVSRTTLQRIVLRCAPRATRIPISRVRTA
jgi:hypothetical protein